MIKDKTISFEDKFKQTLKPEMDKHIHSHITNSMSEVALRKFIENKKSGVDHILEMKNMASSLT